MPGQKPRNWWAAVTARLRSANTYAVDSALAAGARTADIAEPGATRLSTQQMGDAVLNALEKVAGKEREHA